MLGTGLGIALAGCAGDDDEADEEPDSDEGVAIDLSEIGDSDRDERDDADENE